MSATIGAARIELSVNSAKFEAQMKRAQAAVGKFESSLNNTKRKFAKVGRKMEAAGQSLIRNVSLPIIAVGAASVKAAADFQSAFTGVRKTVDATEGDYERLRSSILQMSKQIPASAVEIAGVTETAGQLGVEGVGNLLTFTRTAINMGNATDVSARDAATALARIDAISGGTQQTFDRLGSAVVEIGNNFATTESRILDAAQRLAGIGKVAGLTQSEIVGLAGAATSVSKVVSTITSATANGGAALQRIARVAGQTSAQFQRSFQTDAAGAMTAFIEGLEAARKSGENVFNILDDLGLSGERVAQNILALAGANTTLRDAIGSANKAWADNTALTTEAEKRYRDFNQRLQKSWNRITAVGIAIGTKLMPFVERMVGFVEGLVEGFGELSPAMQNVIMAVGGLGVVLPGLLATLGFLSATVIPAIITGFGVLASATGPILGTVAVIGTLIGVFATFSPKAEAATEAQQQFIDAVEKGNKTLAEAGRQMDSLSTKEQFYATQNLLGKKREQFAEIAEVYRNLDELLASGSDTLQEYGGATAIRQRYQSLKKEIEVMEERKQKLRELHEAENSLHMLRKRFAQFNEATRKDATAGARAKVTRLQKELGLYKQIEDQARETADAEAGQGDQSAPAAPSFSADIGFNYGPAPFGELRSKFTGAWQELQADLQAISGKAELPEIFPDFNTQTARIDAITDTLTRLVEDGVDPSSQAIQQLTGRIKEISGQTMNIDTGGLERFKVKVTDARSTAEIALGGITSKTKSFLASFSEDFKTAGREFSRFMASQVAGAVSSLAESVGQSLAGVGNEFQTGLEKVIGLVANFAKQLGTILIGIGSAISFIPGLQGPGGLYLAAGAALVAISSGVIAGIQKRASNRQSRAEQAPGGGVPALAEGGILTGPSLIVAGDNPNARVDPEVVAPLSKLEGMMHGGQQDVNLSGEFRVKGTDLVLSLERTKQTLR